MTGLFDEPSPDDEDGQAGSSIALPDDLGDTNRPLADRLRPKAVSEVVGQDHLLGPTAPIGRMIAAGQLSSMILWGPAGCGKTSLARLLSQATSAHFEKLSAVGITVAELRKVFDAAAFRRRQGRATVLFLDEIHRIDRGRQDQLLPRVEDGTVTLIGATTENPSFALVSALLSRMQVFVLRSLGDEELESLLGRAERYLGRPFPLTSEAREAVRGMAAGDGRHLLVLAEALARLPPEPVLGLQELGTVLQRRAPIYDKAADGHFAGLSAFHKALRGSDVDAALYWANRMLSAGEAPGQVFRRLVCCASEDVGLADPQAMVQAMTAWQAFDRLGMPEGQLPLAQAICYVALAPKSNAAYVAFGEAKAAAEATGSLAPPMYAMNAPTKMMTEMGFKQGYVLDHETPHGFSGLDFFPPGLPRRQFYRPVARGFERQMRDVLAWLAKLRAALNRP